MREISGNVRAACEKYLELLALWNKTHNLTRVPQSDWWVRHIGESLALWPFLSPDAPLWDIGSGQGTPGIPLAIRAADEGVHKPVVLVEPNRKKAAFLREVAQRLQLDVKVLDMPVERICPKVEMLAAPYIDIASRALAEPPTLIAKCAHLVVQKGKILCITNVARAPDIPGFAVRLSPLLPPSDMAKDMVDCARKKRPSARTADSTHTKVCIAEKI